MKDGGFLAPLIGVPLLLAIEAELESTLGALTFASFFVDLGGSLALELGAPSIVSHLVHRFVDRQSSETGNHLFSHSHFSKVYLRDKGCARFVSDLTVARAHQLLEVAVLDDVFGVLSYALLAESMPTLPENESLIHGVWLAKANHARDGLVFTTE